MQGANLRAWKDEPDLLATGYWGNNWADGTIPIKAMGLATQKITLTEPAPPYGLKTGQRVFFQNALAELDQPGEWFLDRKEGMLYFWPPQTGTVDQTAKTETILSLMDQPLLKLTDTSHIIVRGLVLEATRGSALPSIGFVQRSRQFPSSGHAASILCNHPGSPLVVKKIDPCEAKGDPDGTPATSVLPFQSPDDGSSNSNRLCAILSSG